MTWGEMPDIGDMGMEAANRVAIYVPMQQSCMICTCTPESKVQLKKKYIYIYINDQILNQRKNSTNISVRILSPIIWMSILNFLLICSLLKLRL